MPDSQEFFGTGRAVKVVASVDGERFTTSMLPFGKDAGVHMLPIRAAVRKAIGKESGAEVVVHLERRLS